MQRCMRLQQSPLNRKKREDPFDPSPRTGYLSWDDYFMALAFLSAQRSKDPNKQVTRAHERGHCSQCCLGGRCSATRFNTP